MSAAYEYLLADSQSDYQFSSSPLTVFVYAILCTNTSFLLYGHEVAQAQWLIFLNLSLYVATRYKEISIDPASIKAGPMEIPRIVVTRYMKMFMNLVISSHKVHGNFYVPLLERSHKITWKFL